MKVQIDNEELFKEKLKTGINLFTGAGFSVLPFDGISLPDAKNLCKEVCGKFNISESYGEDLETISALAPKHAYQSFLRERFKVSGCNALYKYINNININSFITTNIDNIPYLIISSGNRYFLRNMAYYGASKSKNVSLDYIPLHGDVININLPLYFGKFDLSIVDDVNRDLFNEMYKKLLESPTIFWGYNFHDNGVMKIISKILNKQYKDLWIQCLPTNTKMINFFKEMRCNIIIADTSSLLKWIKENIQISNIEKQIPYIISDDLKRYSIPKISDPDIESLPASEYYVKGNTHWYPILTNQAFELSIVNKIYNELLKNKNTIIVGGHFTGKSTLLMQLALKIEANNKLFIKEAISKEEAHFIISKINNAETWIFCEKGILDIAAFRIFSEEKNIKLISISDDYSFETSKHLLEGVEYFRIEIGEIEQREAELLYEYVPQSLRKEIFHFKDSENEKFSMLEFILKNINGVFSREKITDILLSIQQKNTQAIQTIALASYLVSNNSALSTDVLFSFFKLSSYDDVKKIISSVNSALNDFNVNVYSDLLDQDYYILRSKLFAKYAYEAFLRNSVLKKIYANVIKDLIYTVSFLKIYNYHIFKRKAYDGMLFAELFKDKGIKIYDFLYNKFENPYILQQKALFLGKLGRYEEAFACINKAQGELPNNFSIKNSEAILLFEANRMKNTNLSISKLDEAMTILDNCYNNDKRKVYHAQKYAKFALFLYTRYDINKYIAKAKTWINEIVKRKDSLSKRTLNLQRDLNYID